MLERINRWTWAALAAPFVYWLLYALPGTGPMLARNAPPAVLAIGVIYGTVTALGAMALILTYRSNRFVNFAYGAMGSMVGVFAIGMYKEHGVPYFVVLPVGVVFGALMGGLVEVGVLRRFRNASRLVLTVASIGLAQLLGGFEAIGSTAIKFVSFTGAFKVPGPSLDLGVKTLGGDEMLIVFIAPLVLFGLMYFLLRTDTGTAVRAAAENESRALLLGIPVRRNTTVVWMIVGGLATLTFILKAPFSGVTPGIASNGPAVLLPALAAAVVARMESLPTALVAGIALGIIEQLVRWNSTTSPSVVSVVFLLVIVGALLVQRSAFSRSAEGGESTWSATGVIRPIPDALKRLPEVRVARGVLITVAALAMLFVPKLWSPSTQLLAAFAIVWAIVAISLVVLTGWGGNISLGQFGVAGAGAMVAGNLIARNNLDLIFVLLLAGVAGAAIALVIGLPALRIKGLFLAVTTIAFAVALDSYFLNVNNFSSLIPSRVARPLLFGRFDLEDQYTMYVLCVVILFMWLVIASGLRAARTGRTLIATRDNERAAAASAIAVNRTKLTGFLLAGAIAGVAGGLHVQLLHSLSPGSYPVNDSITVFSTTVIGGLGSLTGAVSGVLFFRWIESISELGQLRLVVTGVGLLFVLLVLPGGFGQIFISVRDRLLRRVADRRGIEVPEFGNANPDADDDLLAKDAVVERDPVKLTKITAPILECAGVDLAYGQRQIIFGLDFAVARGEMVALLGTNGAGKSTLLKGICGLLPPKDGTVFFDGQEITGEEADRTTRRGISLMLGGGGVFPTLTVADNLRMATWLFRNDTSRVEESLRDTYALFPVLEERRQQRAGDLSGGEQQMLALAGALMSRPAVLMIDELSLGLAPTVVAQLLEVVRGVHRSGTTVVIVEQSVNVALELAERAVFMEKGQIRFEGKTEDLLARPDLLRSVFIAGTGEMPAPRKRTNVTAAFTEGHALDVRGVNKRYGGITAVDDVDFTVEPGEIVGIIGHNGAGKTTLMDCISGFTEIDGGSIRLNGEDVTNQSPRDRAILGLGRSFQEARLFPTLTVAETLAIACERHIWSRSILADGLRLPASTESEEEVTATVDELIELMGLTPYRGKLIGELSTGTRRVVDLACILAQEPSVLLLDEPSSGVAQKETEALVDLLERVRERTGCAMVVIEHDMPLLRAICDRMVALELGRVITAGTPDDVLSHPQVIESYLGTDAATINRSGKKSVRSRNGSSKRRVPARASR